VKSWHPIRQTKGNEIRAAIEKQSVSCYEKRTDVFFKDSIENRLQIFRRSHWEKL
jgi:hypothetical protein